MTLDATIVLAPADIAAPHGPPARRPARPSALPPPRSSAAGNGLAEAVRSINDGAELLAEARALRRGSPSGS